jgi:hypothetical protein
LGAFRLSKNNALTDFTGLDNLSYIGGHFNIYQNGSLSSFNGLSNLSALNGSLSINGNPSLSDLTGLINLSSIDGDLRIQGNYILTDLYGLENIDPSSIHNLYINNNASLTECSINSVCGFLWNPSGSVNIHNNAPGCYNPPEVAAGCGITVNCLPYGNYYFNSQTEIDNFSSNYPDCHDLNGIEYTLNQPAVVTITIFNHLGKQIDFIRGYQQGGKQSLQWQPQGLPSGMYYFRLQAGDQISTGKVVQIR